VKIQARIVLDKQWGNNKVTCPSCLRYDDVKMSRYVSSYTTRARYCLRRSWLSRKLCALRNKITEDHWHVKCAFCRYKYLMGKPVPQEQVEEFTISKLESLWKGGPE